MLVSGAPFFGPLHDLHRRFSQSCHCELLELFQLIASRHVSVLLHPFLISVLISHPKSTPLSPTVVYNPYIDGQALPDPASSAEKHNRRL